MERERDGEEVKERRGEARRPLERADTCVLLRTLGIRACGERHVYACVCVCVRACVCVHTRVCVWCAVCRNQWKRVEEAAWQERTVGRRTRRRRAAGGGGWQSVGRRMGGWGVGWGGWVGEADCTRCAVRLTACALRRRPTTLLFEKGREGLKGEGARDGWNGGG